MKLFKNRRKKPATKETAPQWTRAQQRAFQMPGWTGGAIPPATLEAMERDSMIQTALTIKRLAVTGSTSRIMPANGSAQAARRAEFAEEAFARMQGSALTVLHQAMDAFVKGWSVQELVFEEADGQVWLKAAKPKDPSNFGLSLDQFGTPRELILQLPGETPIELPREKFVLYMNRPSYGRPKGRSDLEAAYPHWQAKQRLLAAWRVHLERFASPTVLGKYTRGLPADEQSAILGALQRLQDNTAIVFPSEIEIGTLGGSQEASSGFQEAIEFHNREMARSILGQTLTTDEGRRVGSLALGKVHLQVLLLQVNAIRAELADLVMTEQVLRPLIEMNFGPGDLPRFELETVGAEAFSTGRI